MLRRSRDEQGVTGVEYALLIAVVSVVLIFAVPGLSGNLSNIFSGKVIPALGNPSATPTPVDRVCVDGVYAGDYSDADFYWVKVRAYENGSYYDDGWSGNVYAPTYEQRGALIKQEAMTWPGDGVTLMTVFTYENGRFIDVANGEENDTWEATGNLQYNESEKGALQSTYWLIATSSDVFGGTHLSTPPDDGLDRVLDTDPCYAAPALVCDYLSGHFVGTDVSSVFWIRHDYYDNGRYVTDGAGGPRWDDGYGDEADRGEFIFTEWVADAYNNGGFQFSDLSEVPVDARFALDQAFGCVPG